MEGWIVCLAVYWAVSLVWAVVYCKIVYAPDGPGFLYVLTLVFAPVLMPVLAVVKAFELFGDWISTPFKKRAKKNKPLGG
jgi:hypothetical protein